MKFSLQLVALGLVFSFVSCSNELDLTADWKDIPIVYGLLSVNDTAHYIRVEKAFLDPNESALVLAKNPDSLYYLDATVNLKRESTEEVFDLRKVNGTNEGYPRDTGIWAEDPNFLYKISKEDLNLQPNELYTLILDKGDSAPKTEVSSFVLDTPTLNVFTQKMNLKYPGSPYTVYWVAPDNAVVYDIYMIIRYQESTEADPNTFHNKTITWPVVIGYDNAAGDDNYRFEKVEFFEFLKDNLDVKPVKRRFIDASFKIVAGGQELKDYFSVSRANTGITGSETVTNYTNIPDGYGIYSSISYDQVDGLYLNEESVDSLINGSITITLNFEE